MALSHGAPDMPRPEEGQPGFPVDGAKGCGLLSRSDSNLASSMLEPHTLYGWEDVRGRNTSRLMRKCMTCGHVQMWRSFSRSLYGETVERSGGWVSREHCDDNCIY